MQHNHKPSRQKTSIAAQSRSSSLLRPPHLRNVLNKFRLLCLTKRRSPSFNRSRHKLQKVSRNLQNFLSIKQQHLIRSRRQESRPRELLFSLSQCSSRQSICCQLTHSKSSRCQPDPSHRNHLGQLRPLKWSAFNLYQLLKALSTSIAQVTSRLLAWFRRFN